MSDLGRALMAVGALVFVVGAVLLLAGRVPWLGRLPGDIVVRRDHFTFTFPLATSIVVSAILSLLLYWLRR